MDKLEIREKLWGGIFGTIAIFAAVAEMFVCGVNLSSVFGMIKDVFGTLVVVLVMVTVAKTIMPKKETLTFEDKLSNTLNHWVDAHSNMVVKTSKMPQGHENDFGISMTTDINRFYNTEKLKSDNGNGVGRFLRITHIDKETYKNNNVKLEFFINAQTYSLADNPAESAVDELFQVATRLSSYIRSVIDGIECGELRKVDARTVIIPITFKEAIVSDSGDRIDFLLNVINRMYEAMLVSARRR